MKPSAANNGFSHGVVRKKKWHQTLFWCVFFISASDLHHLAYLFASLSLAFCITLLSYLQHLASQSAANSSAIAVKRASLDEKRDNARNKVGIKSD